MSKGGAALVGNLRLVLGCSAASWVAFGHILGLLCSVLGWPSATSWTRFARVLGNLRLVLGCFAASWVTFGLVVALFSAFVYVLSDRQVSRHERSEFKDVALRPRTAPQAL